MPFLWFGRKKVTEANDDVKDYFNNLDSANFFDTLQSQGWQYPGGMGTRDVLKWDRDQINRHAYELYTWNPLVKGTFDGLIDMYIGSGMTISHPNDRVNAEIQKWIKSDDAWLKLRKFIIRYFVHGEVMPILFINTLTGDMQTRELDPAQVKSIKFDDEDYEKAVELYCDNRTKLKWDETSKDMMPDTSKTGNYEERFKHNERGYKGAKKYTIRDFLYWRSVAFSNSLRGMSALTPVMDIITHISKMNMIVLLLAEARLSRREVWTVPPGQVAGTRAKIDSQGAPTPAEVLVLPDGSTVAYPAANLPTQDYTTYLSQLMRFFCAALGIPESFGTADISAGNYSSNTAKYNEFERRVDSKQNLLHGFIIQWVGRLLTAKVDARQLFPQEIAQGDIIINFPNFPRGYGEALPAIQLALDRGLITPQTAAEKLPFFVDARAEEAKGAFGYANGGLPPQPLAVGTEQPANDKLTRVSDKSPYTPHVPNPDFESMSASELVSRLPQDLQDEVLNRV